MAKPQVITLTPKELLDIVRSQVAGPGAEIIVKLEVPIRKLPAIHSVEIDSKLITITMS